MNFNSMGYLLFLAGNLLVYYRLPQWLRNPFLLIASYFFYSCWSFPYSLLMLFSTAVTYACGRLQERSPSRKKLWLTASLGINLAVLFVFKYFNFTLSLFSLPPVSALLLPVGISFYTFQALGYTIDVYRGDVTAEKSFVDYALFVSFFPQLVAGPIERSKNMLHQIKEPHAFCAENLRDGALPVLWGLFKKIVLADRLAVLVNAVYSAPARCSGAELWLATVAFAVQIYCDFSAYSDIARGSAKMLGFELMENFRCPYLSTSVRQFWRRWHISLSTWFQDYLYIPLGGSRMGRARQLLNLMIVFVVSGLWHGAALTFVLWGVLNGLYQVAAVLWQPLREKFLSRLPLSADSKLLQVWRVLATFFLTCLAWVLFRADSVTDALHSMAAMLWLPLRGTALRLATLSLSLPNLCLLGILSLALLWVDFLLAEKKLEHRINQTVAARYGIYFGLLVLILLFGSYGSGYEPQDFVYFQF